MHTKKTALPGAVLVHDRHPLHWVPGRALHQALGRRMVVVLHPVFVAHHLAVQLVN